MAKEIFVLPANTDLNRGDQALVWETIELMKEVVPDSKFVLFESGTTAKDVHLQSRQTKNLGYEVIPKVLIHPSRISNKSKSNKEHISHSLSNKVFWGIQAVIDFMSSSFLLSRFTLLNKLGQMFLDSSQKQTVERIRACYAVAVKGGGFIHAYGKATDFYTMYFLLYHVMLAQRFNKRVFVFPNSIGPVKGSLTRWLVKRVLRKCELVTVREQVSHDYLKDSLGIQSRLFPDLGFYLKGKSRSNGFNYLLSKGIPLGAKPVVGITLRPYRFPNSKDPFDRYNSYINAIKNFVVQVVEQGGHVVFFAHTLGPSLHEDDRIALKEVINVLPNECRAGITYLEDYELDCKDFVDLYSHIDVMVGTRFHSVIFALNSFVPCIAIGYGGNKSFGIMKDMKLDSFVFSIEEVTTEHLIWAFRKITEDKEGYVERIRIHREYLDSQREIFHELLIKNI